MSTYAFLKSVKKFLDNEVRIMPFNNRSLSPPYPSHLLCFVSRCQVIFLESTCQTTLQVQEKLISHLPVEIYLQLRCYLLCPDTGPAVRKLGNIGALQKYQFRDGKKKGKTVKTSFVILKTKQIFSGPNFRALATNAGKLFQC